MSTIHHFTNQLIDYAGLFPPAKIDMPPVVKNYDKYLRGPHAAKLGRLVVPASRLGELEQAAVDLLPNSADTPPWKITALVPPVGEGNDDFRFALSGISQFNTRHAEPKNGLAIVDAIEIKTMTTTQLQETIAALPSELVGFLEIPADEDPTEFVRLIAETDTQRFFGKIRTGGITPDLIPSIEQVARFIDVCADHLVGWKATAGLHHPLRDEFDLTYQPDSPRATMHGFINVFAAGCFAVAHSLGRTEIEKILASKSVGDFEFGDKALSWGDLQISKTKLGRIRRQYAISFGSCSFTEPTAELVDLGLDNTTGMESAVPTR